MPHHEDDMSVYGYGYGPEEPKLMKPKPKKLVTKKSASRFTAEDAMAPLKMDFETYEEYQELREEVEQRITFMRMEAYDLERKSMDIQDQAKTVDDAHHALVHKQGELESWEQSLIKLSDTLDNRKVTIEKQHYDLRVVADRLQTANRQPLDVINDVLLQLELEVDPIQIAKAIREIGKSLDVKW